MMQIIENPGREQWSEIFARPRQADDQQIGPQVSEILESVRLRGDEALREYSEKFDRVRIKTFQLPADRIRKAEKQLSDSLKQAIQIARDNIYTFHQAQLRNEEVVETTPGVSCWRKSVPIERVGLYIPGGSAPLFSTVLMLGIPAQIAGCKEIVLCSPPDKGGLINPAILYTADLCGIEKVYRIGGAQAIAAMAFGTGSISPVDKIFGPGNGYVTEAKMQISARGIAVDMPAGPSEVLVIADDQANPVFLAADLLSQAEHGQDSQVILLSNSWGTLARTREEIIRQLPVLPRQKTATAALLNSRMIYVEDINTAMEMSNDYAPEHLILNVKNTDRFLSQIRNAGSVFVGPWTPEAAGDYASGTNHTLPTGGAARSFSGLSVDNFMKKITFQTLTREGLSKIGHSVAEMAGAEKLEAHRNAVLLRLKQTPLEENK